MNGYLQFNVFTRVTEGEREEEEETRDWVSREVSGPLGACLPLLRASRAFRELEEQVMGLCPPCMLRIHFPQNSHAEALIPSVMVMGAGAFGNRGLDEVERVGRVLRVRLVPL